MKERYPKEYADCMSFIMRLKKSEEDKGRGFDDGYDHLKNVVYTWLSVYVPNMPVADAWDFGREITEEFWGIEESDQQTA